MTTPELRDRVGVASDPARSAPFAPLPRRPIPLVVAALLVGVLGVSFIADGFYRYELWAPLALGSFALIVALVVFEVPALTRAGLVALGSLAGLTVWSAASITWAASVDRAWTEVDRLAFYLALLVLGLMVARTPRAARAILYGLGGGVALSGVYVLTVVLIDGGSSLFLAFRLHEPLGYANGQAGLFLMGFFCLIAAAEEARSPWLSGAACAGAALLGNLVVLTQTRAALPAVLIVGALILSLPGRQRRGWLLVIVLLAVAAALPFTLDVYREKGIAGRTAPEDGVLRAAAVACLISLLAAGLAGAAMTRLAGGWTGARRRRLSAIVLAAVPIASIVAVLVAVGNPVGALERQWNAFRSLDPTPYTTAEPRFTTAGGFRYDLWRIAWRQFERNPLTGVGAGSFVETYYRERRSLNNVRQPHSLQLQFLGELGLPGALLLMTFAVTTLLAAFRPPSRGVVRSDTALRVAALGVFGAWLVHTSVDWLYNLPGVTAMALLAAGILLGHQSNPGPRRRAWLPVVGVIVVAAVVAASVGRHYGAALYRDRSEVAIARDSSAALVNARRSLSLNRHDVMTYIAASAAYARLDQYEFARGSLLAATREEPFNHVLWALLGDLATRRGDFAQAREDYARAQRLNPLAQITSNAPAESDDAP